MQDRLFENLHEYYRVDNMQQCEHSLTRENLLSTSYSEPLCRSRSQTSVLTPKNVFKPSSHCTSRSNNGQQLQIVGQNTVNTVLCIKHNNGQQQYNYQNNKNCSQEVNGDDLSAESLDGYRCQKCVQQLNEKTAMLIPPSTSKAFGKGYRGKCIGFGKIINIGSQDNNDENPYSQFQTDLVDPMMENFVRKDDDLKHQVIFMHGCQQKVFDEMLKLFLQATVHKFEYVKIKVRVFKIVDDKIIDMLQGNTQVRNNQYQIKHVGNRVQIQGVNEFEVNNQSQIQELVTKITMARWRAMHACWENGHTIFDIIIEENNENQPVNNKQSQKPNFCVSMVSLGFVEQQNEDRKQKLYPKNSRKIKNSSSNMNKVSSQTQRNNLYVNTSSSILSRCLQNLKQSQKTPQNSPKIIIPYRESKLTHIFRDVLHGHGQIFLLAVISDQNFAFDQTLGSVRFVQQATTSKPVIKQLNFSKSGNYYNNVKQENSFTHMHALSPTNSSCTSRSVFCFDRSQIVELEEKNSQLLKVIQQLTQEGDSELLATQLALTHKQLQQFKKENGILKDELLNARQHMSLQQEALEVYQSENNINNIIQSQKNVGCDFDSNEVDVQNFECLTELEEEQVTDESSLLDAGDENDSLMSNLNIHNSFVK